MRRITVLTVLVPIALGLANARPVAAQLSLRGGMNLSKFVGGDAESESKTKLKLGASMALLHLGPISITPEVYYAQRGMITLDARLVRGLDRLTEDSAGGDVKNQSISLMLGYSIGAGGMR